MAAVRMYIDKFKREVIIDDDHPDAIAQVERNRSPGTGVDLPPRGDVLRTDGPTLAEFMKAGYKAENYPPKGYAPRGDSNPIPTPSTEPVAPAPTRRRSRS